MAHHRQADKNHKEAAGFVAAGELLDQWIEDAQADGGAAGQIAGQGLQRQGKDRHCAAFKEGRGQIGSQCQPHQPAVLPEQTAQHLRGPAIPPANAPDQPAQPRRNPQGIALVTDVDEVAEAFFESR